MTTAIDFIRPSSLSATGRFLDDFYTEETSNAAAPFWKKTADRIVVVAKVWMHALIDLGSWVFATVFFWVAQDIGLRNHVTQLTSAIAICILSLGIPFGYRPHIDFLRPCQHLSPSHEHQSAAHPFIQKFANPWTREAKIQQLIIRHLESPRGEQFLQKAFLHLYNDSKLNGVFQLFIESLLKTCLDQKRMDLVNWIRKAMRSAKDTFSEETSTDQKSYLLLGENLNALDRDGRTLFMHASGWMTPMQIDSLVTWSQEVDPRLGMNQVNVNVRTPEGFDALSLILAGLRPRKFGKALQPRNDLLTNLPLDNPYYLNVRNQYFGLIHNLCSKDAFIREWGFEEYRDFLQTCLETNGRLIRNFIKNSKSHRNCYIRAYAHLVHNTDQISLKRFLTHAKQLVQHKPTLLQDWEHHRKQHLQEHTEFLSDCFHHHNMNDGFFTNSTTANGTITANGAALIAEYWMSDLLIFSQNPT